MKRLTSGLLFFCLLACPAWAVDGSADYYVPPSQFNAALQVMDFDYANMFALFGNGTGSFSFDETTKILSNFKCAIDATSLIASNQANQRDLANMLESFQAPEIRIVAPDAVTFTDNKAQLKGNLMLHGVTKPITLDVVLNRTGKTTHGGGLWGGEGDAAGLSLRSSFKRSDFGIGDNPMADTPKRFGDTVNLMIELEAIRQ